MTEERLPLADREAHAALYELIAEEAAEEPPVVDELGEAA